MSRPCFSELKPLFLAPFGQSHMARLLSLAVRHIS
jgi:hypothetical protein